MKHAIGEYNVELNIPTDNFVFSLFTSWHTQYMQEYLQTVTQQISNDTALVILFGAFANLHEYDHWILPLNNLKQSIKNPLIVFNGRLTSDNRITIKPNFKYHKVCFFDHVSNINCYENIKDIDSLKNSVKEHKFYWASSKDLYPRRFLLATLFENNLIENNLVNYKCLISHIPSDYLDERMTKDYVDLVSNKCEIIKDKIPLPYLDETIEFNLTNKKFYNQSYIGIITDTFYADHGGPTGIFFSEKVFQAINHHQLFFYIGPPYSLKYLKDLGYHIFDDVFDLNYDSEEDHGKRLVSAVTSLIHFLNKPISEIQKIYQQNAQKIYENKLLLQNENKINSLFNLMHEALNEN